MITYLLGGWLMWDGLAARGAPMWKLSYATFVLMSLGWVAFRTVALRQKLPVDRARWVFAGAGLSALFLAPAVMEPVFIGSWVAGDFAITLGLPLMYLVATLTLGANDDGAQMRRLALLALVAVMVSYCSAQLELFPEQGRSNGRHDAPHMVLIATACLGMAGLGPGRLIAVASFAACLLFAFTSGWRGVMLLAPVMALLAALFVTPPRAIPKLIGRLLVAGAVLIGAGALVGSAAGLSLVEVLSETRFRTLVNDKEDSSLGGRSDEARDIVRVLRETENPVFLIAGRGHGATFIPRLASPGRNFSEEHPNRVHHIHIGIVLIAYRYGLIGVGLFALLSWLVGRRVVAAVGSTPRPQDFTPLCFLLATFGTLCASFVYNVWQNPVTVFCVAGFLITRGELLSPPAPIYEKAPS